jgi:hypothetical protein
VKPLRPSCTLKDANRINGSAEKEKDEKRREGKKIDGITALHQGLRPSPS